MKIKCSEEKGGCGQEVKLTSALLADLRQARDEGADLGCPNASCSRRISADDVKKLVDHIESKLVLDPSTVPGPKSLKAIGAVGTLSTADLEELRAGSRRVAELMCDGNWYTAEEIREAAGTEGKPATEGLRRLRELRELPGISIEREKIPGTRSFRYKLVRS